MKKDILNKIQASKEDQVILKEFFVNNRKLAFVKKLKELTGLGLREAKEYTDDVYILVNSRVIELENIFVKVIYQNEIAPQKWEFYYPFHCSLNGQIGYVAKGNDNELCFFFIDSFLTLDYKIITMEQMEDARPIT